MPDLRIIANSEMPLIVNYQRNEIAASRKEYGTRKYRREITTLTPSARAQGRCPKGLAKTWDA